MRSDVAVVTTSINARPEAYAEWAKCGQLIVAGDLKTPPELEDFVASVGGQYLSPRMQRDFSVSESIGWNCIQRRNVALLQALVSGYEYILTVDDDNHPRPSAYDFITKHIGMLGTHPAGTVIGALSGYVNPGDLCVPRFHARGVPYGVNTSPRVEHSALPVDVVVSQAQVIGDPDCDAVERICHAPNVLAVASNAVMRPGVVCPINSQSTLWHRKWAPVMACMPGVGRYDDMLASYIFARLGQTYGVGVFVGEPVVTQVRNEHDLHADLRAEYWGMSHVFDICTTLGQAHISSSMPLWDAYENLIMAISHLLPKSAIEFAHAWTREWKKL